MDDLNEQKELKARDSDKKDAKTADSELDESEVETSEIEGSEAEGSEPEASEVEDSEVEDSEPEASEVETSEIEGTEIEDSEVEDSEIEGTEIEGSEVEGSEVEGSEPEASEVEGSEVEGSEPEASEVEAFEPEGSEPEASKPESSELDDSQLTDDEVEASETEVVEEKEGEVKSKKGLIVSLILLGFLFVVIAVIYIGGIVYFQERFFFNTQVNGVDFSRQKATDARAFVESKANDYYITIIGKNGHTEIIYASEVNLRFEASGVIEELFEAQNPFEWPLSLLNSQEIHAGFDSYFDEELLTERVLKLEVVTEGQTSPVSANVIMEGNEVVIVPHEYGNVINVELLNELLQEYVSILAAEFNAKEADIFIQPELTTASPEIVDTFEAASNYLSAKITYTVGSDVVVDRDLISSWMTIDDDFNIHLDEQQISEWLSHFIDSVNTLGTTRELTTPNGRNVRVTGGYYGWVVSRDLEFYELLENIRNGDEVEREPIFFQRAAAHGAHDWGNTFLQVDLSGQHMWAFINGEMVFESPVVTGRPGYNTPQGVYFILEMLSPNVLISPWLDDDGDPTYETHVYYWMRTTWSGHGFHDAPWQDNFGGDHYLEYGSHGCTNLPLEAARELYGLIFHMMPVVVHY